MYVHANIHVDKDRATVYDLDSIACIRNITAEWWSDTALLIKFYI